MKIINPSIEILTETTYSSMLNRLERIGRVCYKSEDKIKVDSAEGFIRGIIYKEINPTIVEVRLEIVSETLTNADCIRSMSDIEIAKLFVQAVADGCPPQMDWDCAKDADGWEACDACWCKWLKQPAEEVQSDG